MDLELKKSIEVLLFVHDHPLSTADFQKIIGKKAKVADVEACLEFIAREYALADKPYGLEKISGGWQLLSRPEYDSLIRQLVEVKKHENLTRAQLETLSVIAYTQPVTKGDIDGIRGVNSSPMIKTLMERGFIHVVGRAERIGSPPLYGTSRRFLEVFGLKDISEMPERQMILDAFKQRLKSKEEETQEKGHAQKNGS